MEFKQIAPWNWFKREEEAEGRNLPIMRQGFGGSYPAPLARFHEEFDQLFENMLQCFPYAPSAMTSMLPSDSSTGWLKPSVDIAETDKEYTISAELPGVDEKDIDVELSGDSLLIRGKKEHEKEENKNDYHCVERSYGAFQRQLSLPEDADADNIKADFKKGVLTLTVPRKPGHSGTAKQIDVHAA